MNPEEGLSCSFFFQAEDGIRDDLVTGVQTCAFRSSLQLAQTENIVAICDVDMPYCERAVEGKLKDGQGNDRPEALKLKEQFTKAKKYADFREMLDKERGIEAVVIA